MGMKRRAIIMLSLLFIVFFGLMIRISLLSVDNAVKTVGNGQGSKTIMVAEVRGTIYDRNRVPLVNGSNAYYATLLPEERLLQRVAAVTDTSEYERLREAIKDRTPLLARLNGPAAITDGLRVYMAPKRYDTRCIAPHLIGYLNGSATKGVSGIEKAYDAVLQKYSGRITATFPINGSGAYLAGDELRVENTVARSAGGVILTIDANIQEQVEAVASTMIDKGAVVVLDAANGEVLALASFPSFHPDSLVENVERTDGALVNRAISLYDCGSVFKIVTALAALESGVSSEQSYDCAGAITVDSTTFHCHYRLGHQRLTMEEAFAQSCNTYFIQLAQQIGSDALLDMAKTLGLTDEIVLADSLMAPSAVLPSREDLSAAAALANLSFGQGELLVSPLHIARMTAAIAANGTLPLVSAVLGIVDEGGHWVSSVAGGEETVLSAPSVLALRRMMERVVSDGTGSLAQPDVGNAAGKTGTAETGQRNNGDAVVHSWFTGYYPAEDPQYVITVLVEDVPSDGASAAQIFCEISNNLR